MGGWSWARPARPFVIVRLVMDRPGRPHAIATATAWTSVWAGRLVVDEATPTQRRCHHHQHHQHHDCVVDFSGTLKLALIEYVLRRLLTA